MNTSPAKHKSWREKRIEQNNRFEQLCKSLSHDKLAAFLGHNTSWMRTTAAMEIRKRGTERGRKLGLSLCRNDDWKMRESGAVILSQINVAQHRKLVPVLDALFFMAESDPRSIVRAEALIGIGHRAHTDAVSSEYVFSIIDKSSRSRAKCIRYAAAFSLSSLKCEGLEPVLLRLMRDKDYEVRDWAVFAVRVNGYDTPAIRDVLLTVAKDPYVSPREEAIHTLAELGETRVLPAMRDTLHFYMGNKSNEFHEIVVAISELGDPSLLPDLEQLLEVYPTSEILVNTIDGLKARRNCSSLDLIQ